MSGGWVPMPVDTWPDVAALLEAKGEGWTESLAAYDLRWHENEVRMGRRKSMPGAPFFSERWGWSRYYTRGLMRNEEAWVDGRFARPLPVDSPPSARECGDNEGSSVDDSPSSARPLPVNHHTRGGEQPNNSTTQQELTAPQAATGQPPTGGKKTARVIPSDLLDAYNAYRKASGITRTAKLNPHKGMGLKIWRIHEECGTEAVGLFQWLEKSQNGRAPIYRRDKRTAETVLRHLEGLLDEVSAKESPGSHSPHTARANTIDTPAHIFIRAYHSARGQHPAWLDHVPSDERNRFEEASRKCNGLTMVRTMGSHNLDRKRVIDTFNQTFEETQ